MDDTINSVNVPEYSIQFEDTNENSLILNYYEAEAPNQDINISCDSTNKEYFMMDSPENLQPMAYVKCDYSESGEQQCVSKTTERAKTSVSIQAEKKRKYRTRLKQENPGLWAAIKEMEACKRREQREERRQVLLEMQKTLDLISTSDASELETHKMHLDSLRNQYPQLWNQLMEAQSAAEKRNSMLTLQSFLTNQKRLPKPVKEYKNVIEAQKKYQYRQRLKAERPDVYAKQKARDAYAKSMKRQLLKQQMAQINNLTFTEDSTISLIQSLEQ